MQNSHFKTSKKAFNRVVEAGLRQFIDILHPASLTGARAGMLSLFLCGSAVTALGQAQLCDEFIDGTIQFCVSPGVPLSPSGPVMTYMSSIGGFSGGTVEATGTGVAAPLYHNAGVVGAGNSVTYQVTVDTDCTGSVGYPYNLSARMVFGPAQQLYGFEGQPSGPVFNNNNPALPGATVDLCECPGLVRVRFVDGSGNPVSVSGGVIQGYISAGASQQAYASIPNGSTEKRILVRGNYTGYVLDVSFTSGTDPYSDLIFNRHRVVVNTPCDAELVVDCIVPTGNPNLLGKIVGRVDMLTECEHRIGNETFMRALSGPAGNYRYDTVPLDGSLPLPGCSQGPFELENLVPSATEGYSVWGTMFFRLGRRSEYFLTPVYGGAHNQAFVTAGQTLNLGNAFVMDPGWVRGNIFLCGAPEPPGRSNACLRFLHFDSEVDSDHDGIPDNPGINSSYVSAVGDSTPASGAIQSAFYGFAAAEFEGNYGNGAFTGDYELVVAGLNQQASRWDSKGLQLRFQNFTPVSSYHDSIISIVNNLVPTYEIQPGQAVTNDHCYCFSEVLIDVNSTSAPFYGPSVTGSGAFIGTDFKNNPADYSVRIPPNYPSHGTPLTPASAALTGQIKLCLPQGKYNLSPRVQAQNPDGTFSDTALRPIANLIIGCKQLLVATPDLQVYLTNVPPCTSNAMFTFSGGVNSLNPVDLSYSLNGSGPVPVCNNCALNTSFNIPVTLAPCINTITITAVDHVLNQTASVTAWITLDGTPPVITGCTNIFTTADAGTSGAVVNYTVTALDNCDGPVAVNCDPPSGSFFPCGTNTVSCTATDSCHNSTNCTFKVIVLCDCLDVSNERLTCATNVPGKLNYSFDLQNNTGVPVTYLFLKPKTNCFAFMPSIIKFNPALPPGQTAHTNVMINLTGDCPSNLCFFVVALDSNVVHCCSIMHCIDRDTIGPRLVSAVPTCGGNKITVTFDEPLAPASFLGIPNFIVDDLTHQVSLAFASTSFGADFQTVCLFTAAPLSAGTQYQLTVNNVADACGNVIAHNSQVSFGCTNCVEPPPGLVNWWTFDEQAGFIANDIAGAINNSGLLQNITPGSHVPGVVGNALCFNGVNQHMQVSDATSGGEVDFSGNCFPGVSAESFTIDAWIRPDQATGMAMILDKRESTMRGYTLSLNNGFLRVELNTPAVFAYQGTHFLAANQWHFIAVSYERCANLLKIYVNGSLTPVDTFTTPALGSLANGAVLFVGRQQPLFSPPALRYAGCIDELEFFKRVLSDQEIFSLWNAGSAGKCKPGANVPPFTLAAASVTGGLLTFQWSGNAVLQAADAINGPWTDVEDATSGYRADMNDPRKFYRLKYP